MDQDRLDQIFKESLYNHETVVDKDQLWTAINGKKRRRGGWMFLFGILALTGISGAWLLSSNKATETSTYTTEKSISLSTSDQDLSQSPLSNTRQISEKDAVEINQEASKGIKTIKIEKPSNAINLSKGVSSVRTNESSHDLSHSSQPLKKLVPKSIYEKQSTFTLPNDRSTSETTTLAPTKASPNLVLSTQTLELSSENNIQLRTSKNLNPAAAISTSSELKSLKFERPLLERNDKVECYDYRKKVHPFYAEIYSTIDYIHNRISATPDSLNYISKRDATQTQLEGYRAGLRLKYLTRCGLYFKAGVEASAIRERFDLLETNERTEIRHDVHLETIFRGDSTIKIYGPSPVIIRDTTSWQVWNTYRSVGIPLMIGFQAEQGKIMYGIEIGGIYNIHYDFEGMLLDYDLKPVLNPDYFKSRIANSLTGGLNLGYKLTNRTNVMAYASLKYNLSTINRLSNKVQQANTRIGLGLGLQYRL